MHVLYALFLVFITSWMYAQKPHPTYEHLKQAAEEDKEMLNITSATQPYTPEQCKRLYARKKFYSELAQFPNPKQDYLQKKSKELESKLQQCAPLSTIIKE